MKTNNSITRIKIAAAAAAGVLGLMVAAPAPAADSIAVPVSAVVVGVCKFSTGQSPSVVIANSGGNIDTSLAGPATGTTNILYRCTNGTVPVFALSGGATTTLTCSTPATCGATSMNASMALTPPASPNGQGFATDLTLVLDGQITSATYAGALEGTYTGTTTVTVNP